MSTFILEIGSEELPARFLPGERKALQAACSEALDAASLQHGEITVLTTPRRCTLFIYELSPVQDTKEEILSGPPKRIAYDADGKPSKALEGFLRTQNITPNDLFEQETEKGTYICARRTVGGKKAKAILAEIMPDLILGIPFAKRMRWGESSLAYARPVHWILALLDTEVVPFTLHELTSGRLTYGHRIHGIGPFTVDSTENYLDVLKNQCCITLSGEERRATIVRDGNSMAEKIGGKILWNDRLLQEVEGLVEHPVPLLADFDPCYLEVPREVLITSMESHQKSFGVEDSAGNLLPHFLTVINLDPTDPAVVKKGWERVLHARLEDARFFWKEDLRSNFDTWLAKLDHVIFIGPLGTMGDKTRRLEELCGWIAEKVTDADAALIDRAKRAGRLSKADLVSGMVGEFDTLQGIMGGIYADKWHEDHDVASALKEQYLPAGPETPLPQTLLGAILSIADKADTIAGCFGLRKIPSGTADPNGLRRCALGIIRITQAFSLSINIQELFAKAQALYGEKAWKLTAEDALQKMMEFFSARLQHHLEANGNNVIVTDAILRAGMDTVPDVFKRLAAFTEFQKRTDYIENVQVMKRIGNILQKQKTSAALSIDETLFQDPSEKALADELKKIAAKDTGMYADMLESVASVRPFVDQFFNSVMVLCDDVAVRENRIALLQTLQGMFAKIADFSALQI